MPSDTPDSSVPRAEPEATGSKPSSKPGASQLPPWFGPLWRLLLILIPIGAYKYLLTAHTFDPLIDGAFYTDIARHVRDGEGFATQVSLYHRGYTYFPHPSKSYLLWPTIYGLSARIFPLMRVGFWLPAVFYMFSLVFAYLWARELLPRARLWGFDAGHAFVPLLALTRDYFEFTSAPYTEGLAFCLLFLALWRATPAWRDPSWKRGAELGLWMGLALMARSQNAVFVVAGVGTFAYALVFAQRRKDYAIMLGAFVLVMALFGARSAVQLLNTFGAGGLAAHPGVEAAPELSKMKFMVKTDGVWDFIVDRSKGIPIAFGTESKFRYARQFHLIHYALPAAIGVLIASAWLDLRQYRSRIRDWLRSEEAMVWVFILAASFGSLLLIHSLHKVYFSAWNFARRQSIVCIIPFFIAWLYMARHRWLVIRAAALALLLATNGYAVKAAHNKTEKSLKRTSGKPYKASMAKWLQQQSDKRAEEGKPFVVMMGAHSPQRLAPYTTGVGYHWVYNKTKRRDIELMVRELGAEALILSAKSSKNWSFRRGSNRRWFKANFKAERSLSGLTIYRPVGALKRKKSNKKPKPKPSKRKP